MSRFFLALLLGSCGRGEPGSEPPKLTVTADGWSIGPHPEVVTMLVATWTEPVPTEQSWLSWTFEGVPHTSPRVPREGAVSEVVLGLPEDVSVDVVLHRVVGGEETATAPLMATTGRLPTGLVRPTLEAVDRARVRSEPYLLTAVNTGDYDFFGPCYTVILDLRGRIVWYRLTSGNRLTVTPRKSRSGGYLVLDETVVYVGGDPTVTRTTLDLRHIQPIDVPGLFMTFDEMDDGSILFDGRESDFAFSLTRQHPDGLQERIWDCNAWMASFSGEYWACAPNTLQWDPVENTVLWSMFQTSTVVEVDLATGEPLREFGQFPGGTSFEPPEAMFDLQHNPNWTADGTLLVSTHVVGEPNVQMARELTYDAGTDTLTEVWSAPAARYADYEGGIWKLPSGNYLWELGTAGQIHEIAPSGETVWLLDWDGHLTGSVTPIVDLYALNTGF